MIEVRQINWEYYVLHHDNPTEEEKQHIEYLKNKIIVW